MNPSRKIRRRKERAWDALPGEALLNIFRRSTIGHRARSLPLVCKTWAEASCHPRCWASMIPDGYNYDEIFVKSHSKYRVDRNIPWNDLAFSRYMSHGEGVSRLENLIQRADGGLSITSIFLWPFSPSYSSINDDLLRIIARSCPNLKHLSFEGLHVSFTEAMLDVFRNCTKIELVDFGDRVYIKPVVLTVICNYKINLRGIRGRTRNGAAHNREPSATLPALAKCFPKLMLLNLAGGKYLMDKELQDILSVCTQLQYLKVPTLDNTMPSIKRAQALIPEFVYCSVYYCDASGKIEVYPPHFERMARGD